MASIAEKRRAFRDLHREGCFVLPNPWDVGSARYLARAGFKALASSSAGFAWTQGLADAAVPRDMMLAHLRDLVEATDLPVNADYESGYAHEPEGVAENVKLGIATGVAGLSIEDASGDKGKPLYEFELAVERIRASRAAVDASDPTVTLVARTEGFLYKVIDLAEVIRRVQAFSEAGADCLYAPGLRERDDIAAVVRAVAPKPVNVLMSAATGLTVADLAALGVRRISVGSSQARVAWTGFIRSVRELADEGRFDSFAGSVSHAEMNSYFPKKGP